MNETTHNIDQHMSDLRQILAQGSKRIGILLGAGAPVGINANQDGGKHKPLIPATEGLTKLVVDSLKNENKALLDSIRSSVGDENNIEHILSKARELSSALKGTDYKIGEYQQSDYDGFADLICKEIGKIVSPSLPYDETPYNRLATWMGGTDRKHAVEIFTSNYDLLMEEALEAAKIPFFTGFSGSDQPFFDSASIANNEELPSKWARLWKLHGSLGWEFNEQEELVSGKGRGVNSLIYPDHLKYDHIQKLPYTALFDRLRTFLMTPDTLLLSCGFSFNDAHITAVIMEALEANPSASVFGFLYKTLDEELAVKNVATKQSNFSAYASDKAIIGGMEGEWRLSNNNKNEDWKNIRRSFWAKRDGDDSPPVFLLGDFTEFADFFALSKSNQIYSPIEPTLNTEAI